MKRESLVLPWMVLNRLVVLQTSDTCLFSFLIRKTNQPLKTVSTKRKNQLNETKWPLENITNGCCE